MNVSKGLLQKADRFGSLLGQMTVEQGKLWGRREVLALLIAAEAACSQPREFIDQKRNELGFYEVRLPLGKGNLKNGQLTLWIEEGKLLRTRVSLIEYPNGKMGKERRVVILRIDVPERKTVQLAAWIIRGVGWDNESFSPATVTDINPEHSHRVDLEWVNEKFTRMRLDEEELHPGARISFK
jgi:hypothetical protein